MFFSSLTGVMSDVCIFYVRHPVLDIVVHAPSAKMFLSLAYTHKAFEILPLSNKSRNSRQMPKAVPRTLLNQKGSAMQQ